MDSSRLSQEDVSRLLSDPSADNRAQTAAKIGAQFVAGGLGASEREIIEDIFRIMVRDAAVKVRQALSQSLKDSTDVARDVALALAHDVAEVAIPMIEFSEVLTEGDLIDLIESQGTDHRQAVARRERVSDKVAAALVDSGDAAAVATLVANEGAALSPATMGRVIDNYGHIRRVSEPLALRRQLPLTVAERLVNLVSEKIRQHLVTHHELSPDVAADLFLMAREKATLGLLQPGSNLRDVMELVEQLHRNGRLTPSLILRALCMGDVTFFEAALAVRADIPVANAHKLIHDRSRRGLVALCEKCGLSKKLVKIFAAALDLAEELRLTGGDDRERFRQIMIERVLTQFEDAIDPENLDYFISKLGRSVAA